MAPHYKAGTKIFSKRRGEMFLAQIVKVNVRKNPADPIYTIRYVGKYSRYPEKVKHSESSRKFIKSNMNPIAEARYLMDGCAGTDSRDQQIQHQPSKPSAPGSSRRSREEIWGVDPPKVPWAPTVFRERELQLSEALVEVLKKNSEMIRHKYLPKLPAKFTVAEIIKEFENSIDNRPVIFESIIRDNFLNRVFIGIFNKILRKQLISEFEYHQLDQFEKSIDNFKPSEYYGIAPLIRCLEHYFKDRKLNFEFYMMFKDLMSFLRKNLIKFYYGTDYYELSPEDYIDVAPRKRSRDSETPTTVSWGIPRNLQYASDSECEEYFSENEEESGFLTMPVKLKEVLKMSSEKIRQKYLPILPAEITVVQIIKDFEESLGNMPEKSDFYLDREKFRNFFWVRLIDMFNMQHRALLISEFEYFQLDQFIIEKKSINPGDEFKPSEYYGIVPLIRCLEHFIKNRIVDFDIKGVVKKFMWYLVKNCSKYFSSTTYYELAPEDYQEIVPRKRARRSRSTVPPTTVPVDLEVIEPSSTSEIVKVEPLNQENISTVSSSTVLSSTVLPDALKTEVQDDLEIFDPTSNQFLNFHFQRSDSTEVEVEQNFERILCLSLTTRATTTVSSPTVSSPTVSSPDIKVEDISDNESEVSSSTPNLVKLSPTPTVPSATVPPATVLQKIWRPYNFDLEPTLSTVPLSTVPLPTVPFSTVPFWNPYIWNPFAFPTMYYPPYQYPTVPMPTVPTVPFSTVFSNWNSAGFDLSQMYPTLGFPLATVPTVPRPTVIRNAQNWNSNNPMYIDFANMYSTVPTSTVPRPTVIRNAENWNSNNPMQFDFSNMYSTVPTSTVPRATVIRNADNWHLNDPNENPVDSSTVPRPTVIQSPIKSNLLPADVKNDNSKRPRMYSALDFPPIIRNPAPLSTVLPSTVTWDIENWNKMPTGPMEIEDMSEDEA